MPWLDDVDAVLWAGPPGQEGGHAVAAALLGDIEPAGRLVTTFPTADRATPAWSVTPHDGDLVYTEGPFIGYRGHHADRAPAPAFWFGHGLGYSTWEYTHAHLDETHSSPTVGVTVTNTGPRPSREVVQVYHGPADATQPVRLVGWTAVTLEPGASTRVAVNTDSACGAAGTPNAPPGPRCPQRRAPHRTGASETFEPRSSWRRPRSLSGQQRRVLRSLAS